MAARMSMDRIMKVSEVAALLDWPTWRARRWLRANGAAAKRGGVYVTTLRKLVERFPEVGLAGLAKMEERVGYAGEIDRLSRQVDSLAARLREAEKFIRAQRVRSRSRALRRRPPEKSEVADSVDVCGQSERQQSNDV
jgi:hypothetical protein